MATYSVKVAIGEHCSMWGVYHSVTETMYSPLWDEDHELDAHVFAWVFGDRMRRERMREALEISSERFLIYSKASEEKAQERIRAFFDFRLGEGRGEGDFWRTSLPPSWSEVLNSNVDPPHQARDLDDLVHKFAHGDSVVLPILEELLEWKPTPLATR